MQVQQFARGEPFVKSEIFGQKSDPAAHRHVAGRAAQHERGSAGRLDQAKKHLDGSALSRPVRPQKPEYLAASNLEAQIADRHLVAEDLAQVLRFDRVWMGRGQAELPLLESIGQRHRAAGVSETGHGIRHSGFGPDQRIPRSAAAGQRKKCSARAGDLHLLVGPQLARHG